MTPEGKVKKHLKKALDELFAAQGGWYFMPIGGAFAEKGIPDIIGCWGGRFFAIEVKAKGGTTTKLQQIKMQQIANAEGFVGVCVGTEGVPRVLFDLQNWMAYK
jgi:Holliday junction resolvase